jgi:hypothetical protein
MRRRALRRNPLKKSDRRKAEPVTDVTVANHGSIFLFRLRTAEARQWVDANVADPLWFGGALACEANHAGDLAAGMINDGLNVE